MVSSHRTINLAEGKFHDQVQTDGHTDTEKPAEFTRVLSVLALESVYSYSTYVTIDMPYCDMLACVKANTNTTEPTREHLSTELVVITCRQCCTDTETAQHAINHLTQAWTAVTVQGY